MERNILEVKRLKVSFRTNNGTVKAVRDISFNLKKGKTLAIVGESGSGKSVTSKVILGISAGNAIIEGGDVLFDGKDIIELNEEQMYDIRGDKIAMIFQDPLSSLDPIVKIGKQITEAMILKNRDKRRRSRKAFNKKLQVLKNITKEVYKDESKEKLARIDYIYKEFDKFNVNGLKLEISYNKDLSKVHDLLSLIEEFRFYASKSAKQNLPLQIKNMISIAEHIKDRFLVSQDDAQKLQEFIEMLVTELDNLNYDPKDKKTIVDKDLLEKVCKFEEFLQKLSDKERPNFFRYGYYLEKNYVEDLQRMSVSEANEMTLKFLDENFMSEFKEYATKALKYSYDLAIEEKKKVIPFFDEMLAYFDGAVDLDKKTCAEFVKRSKQNVDICINPLDIYEDTLTKTFTNSLRNFCKKYFKAIIENERDEKRFAKQSAKRDRIVAKGKKVSWKVVPLKNIDLDDIRDDITSLIQRLKDLYLEQIANKNVDFDKLCIDLIDQFKERASNFVARLTQKEAKERAIKLMEEVGIPEPRIRFKQYPFEFSGGMRQRIVIAIALAANPDILICDEPTTALDVTIQAQILELINKIKKERGLSIIFITHDLGVVANMADEIAVMYAGKIVEYGTCEDIFYRPAHPYTWALLSSMPDLDTKEKLEAIPGTPPNMIYPPKGDAFAARNKYAMAIDFEQEPPMFEISETHRAATWLLHPNAPKVEMPKIIQERIKRMREKDGK